MENENKINTQEASINPKGSEAINNEDNSAIDRADQILKSLQEENKKFEQNLKRQEEAIAKQMLSGRSSVHSDEKPKEITPQEYAQKAIKGEFNNERGS